MKRICSYCKSDMGEKCGVCGRTETVLGSINGVFACWNCKRMWVEGSEPDSHGICAACTNRAIGRSDDRQIAR